jgi:hypothetical protein
MTKHEGMTKREACQDTKADATEHTQRGLIKEIGISAPKAFGFVSFRAFGGK